MTPPPLRATYRVQLHKDFTFDDAAALAPYLADLGFSHLYCSPVMAARPGSTHGYDAIDHNKLNPELGGDEGFERMASAMQSHGLGLILDIVPNHVGIGPDNRAWMEVLEWGQQSSHATDFDIDWKSSRRNLEGKVLLPILGDQFGVVLEKGEIALKLDAAKGSISAWYYDSPLPISPLHYARLLQPALTRFEGAASRRIAGLLRDFDALGQHTGTSQGLRESAAGLKLQLAEWLAEDPSAVATINEALAGFGGTPGDRASWNALGALLDDQSYRAAYWRVSSDEINYRRFFDINDLAGLRVERQELFDAMHRKVFELVREGKVQGLRIDHIDGLFDPREYAQRLQAATGKPEQPFPILLEKILAHYEELPGDWPVAGTTGYDTLNLVGGLFIDPASEKALSTLYRRYTKRDTVFDDLLYECKRRIVQENLASELGVLANAVQTLSASEWRSRDFSYAAIRRALEELIARFPVYRTYLDRDARLSAPDKRYIAWAVGVAKKNAGPTDTSIFDFIASILTGELAAEGSPYPREPVLLAAMRFQQLSGPAMAKGLEDTSFYRYFRLIVHNEVGGDPRRFAVSPSAFHKASELRLRQHPDDMIGGSTHDTKRGEDARMRLACLSGMTSEWGRQVSFWTRANRRLIGESDGTPAPDRNHQYYFYQTLVGAWPAELAADDVAGLAELAERVDGAMLKALREGKERTSWTNPHAGYEKAVSQFVRGALEPGASNPFLPEFHKFVQRLAWLGAFTSVSQTLLRLTMPGFPDVYRGSEFWELSMVDPDNRRPIDYADFGARIDSLKSAFEDGEPTPAAAADLVANWRDGRLKVHVIRATLALRKERPALFSRGRYEPLSTTGMRADNLVAFRRADVDQDLVVLAPRLWPQLLGEGADSLAAADWGDTAIGLAPGTYVDLLSGRLVQATSDALPLVNLLADFPACLLLRS